MTKETLFEQIDEIFGDWHGGVCYIGKERENQIKEILEKAINYNRCCTELLCVDKWCYTNLTEGKIYKLINQDDEYYTIIDDFNDMIEMDKSLFEISKQTLLTTYRYKKSF